MINKIKAVFFDIDGTLVSFKTHTVPQETINAIRQLRKSGVKVFIATGRMLGMTDVLNGIEFDGYIAYNGACCVDSTKEKVIYKSVIPKDELDALVARLEYDKFPVSFMCRHNMYVNYINDTVLDVAKLVNVAPPKVQAPQISIKEDIFQLCVYTGDEKLDEIIKEVLPKCEYSRWIPAFADVNLKGMNKQAGIDKMLEYFNIALCDTMAFGDGGNDIPMLKHVAVGIAMGNAGDNVKEAANYITSSVDDYGVVNALKHFGMLKNGL
ncbi:MAG: Cof-type HAD-IIB family hydrolase [Bacteroidales bacterium]